LKASKIIWNLVCILKVFLGKSKIKNSDKIYYFALFYVIAKSETKMKQFSQKLSHMFSARIILSSLKE
jgi:hypothetical protein